MWCLRVSGRAADGGLCEHALPKRPRERRQAAAHLGEKLPPTGRPMDRETNHVLKCIPTDLDVDEVITGTHGGTASY